MKARLVGLAALSLVFLAADAPDNGVKKDQEKLQGAWTMQSAQHGGDDVPSDKIAGLRLVIDGDKYTLTKDGKVVDEGTIKLDAGKKIDIQSTKDETKKLKGIYQIDGDTYKEALAPEGSDRPTELVSKAGSDVILLVLQREKK